MEVELTGEEVFELLRTVVSRRDAQSGARIKYRTGADKKPEIVSAKLIGDDGKDKEIDPKTTYRIVTIDYLLSVAGGDYRILKQAREVKPLGITLRDALIQYVKGETAAKRSVKGRLDGRFGQEGRADKVENPK